MRSPALARLRSLWLGARLPGQALRLILRQPRLLFWSLLPIVLTLVLYYVVIGALVAGIQGLLSAWFVHWGLDPGSWLYRLLDLMSQLVLLLTAALTFAFTSSVLASPLNDRLAEAAEAHASPALAAVAEGSARQQLRLVAIDLGKALAAGAASLAALLLAWIPVVNLVSFALAFQLVSFQYLSYPQTRRGIGLLGGLHFLWRHAWACTGFGATVSVLFALPVLSSLALPLAVVGGTLLAARGPGGPGLARLR